METDVVVCADMLLQCRHHRCTRATAHQVTTIGFHSRQVLERAACRRRHFHIVSVPVQSRKDSGSTAATLQHQRVIGASSQAFQREACRACGRNVGSAAAQRRN